LYFVVRVYDVVVKKFTFAVSSRDELRVKLPVKMISYKFMYTLV